MCQEPVVHVAAPCVLAETASVADGDHYAGQFEVLLDGCDGSAARTIKF